MPGPTCSVTLCTADAARREPRQQLIGEMQARGRRRDRAFVAREQGLVVGAVLLVGLALGSRYRAAAACRRARRWPGPAPARERRTTASPRRPRPWLSTVASSWPRKQTLPSSPKRTTSPGASFLAGRTKARQREPSSRSVKRRLDLRLGVAADAPAGQPRRNHLVSLTTSASPGLSRSGKSRTPRSSSSACRPAAPPAAAPHRAARPAAARCARVADRSRTDRCACYRSSFRAPRSGEPGIQ